LQEVFHANPRSGAVVHQQDLRFSPAFAGVSTVGSSFPMRCRLT
jgi:hypothetical protein